MLARTADNNIDAGAITAITAIVAYATKVNPLWVFLAGGILGLSGWL